MNKFFKIALTGLLFISLMGMARAQGYDGKHEWRAVWIATVNNIDWPSKPGLTSEQQQKELIEYFDLFTYDDLKDGSQFPPQALLNTPPISKSWINYCI